MKRAGAVALTALIALAVPTTAQANPEDPLDRFERTDSGPVTSDFVPASADGAAKVTVMVELAADPVAVVDAASPQKLTKAQRDALKAQRKAEQDKLKPAIAKLGGQVRSQVQTAYNGVKVTVARKDVASLEALPGVAAVHRVQTMKPTNATSVPYLGVDQVWEDNGYTGDGIKVAIIDTGIDYTHATFGGPGTTEAFEAASAGTTPNPAWFGPASPRVKGGWDFVGDAYDASDPANATPIPDGNPIDCNGHGTHVAGTTGGSGVLADGTTYGGPYDAATSENSFLVGPGVAPEVDLYALKVFGCEGSTDVTVEAIDWAVANGMDVINMSLGSDYGTADDPSAVAARNAAADGVVVVASAGNAGPNPYLSGSPGSGDGVISVAANDATEIFPGATLSVDDQVIEAINANGAELPAGPYEVVVLTDNPATAANESLGCAVSDYTAAGVSAAAEAPLQIAVTTRGTCARVARGVFGQQAGADAVVMISNDTEGPGALPPFEGPITEDPVTGIDYNVTIPFLGVRSSDGAALKAADGDSLTLAPVAIDNPGFEGYGSFTSAGPRSGDSALKPTVTAPGVSIASAAVGSGTGAMFLSGTSMAAPHVAGVAALGVQAHPDWSGQDVSSALVSTADPESVAGYRLTRGGGLVDPSALVTAETFAYGDVVTDEPADFRESTLSFGFAEIGEYFEATRTVTVVNTGSTPVTYAVAYEATDESLPAAVTLNTDTVTVPAGGSATVDVTLAVEAADVPPTFSAAGQHQFREVSGNVILTSGDSRLTVGALLVPRPATNVAARLTGSLAAPSTSASVTLTNEGAAIAADADFYTWGLDDAEDQSVAGGFDLKAAGVQAIPVSGDTVLVFAVSTHDRFSNAASVEFDVLLDTNRNGKDDLAVFAYDSGAIRAGDADGTNEVFIYNYATGAIRSAGFLALSPTDSSTVLIPVMASDLGLKGAFRYSVNSFYGDAWDQFSGRATYDPARKALTDGMYAVVPADGTTSVNVGLSRGPFSSSKPLGLMAVSYDNPAGEEAALIRIR